jgi:hypothetical protein
MAQKVQSPDQARSVFEWRFVTESIAFYVRERQQNRHGLPAAATALVVFHFEPPLNNTVDRLRADDALVYAPSFVPDHSSNIRGLSALFPILRASSQN